MNGVLSFVILTAGFSGILYYGKMFIKAWNETYAEIRFKCKNVNECKKRCGMLCRTFGECDMCEADSDNCSKCVCNAHRN